MALQGWQVLIHPPTHPPTHLCLECRQCCLLLLLHRQLQCIQGLDSQRQLLLLVQLLLALLGCQCRLLVPPGLALLHLGQLTLSFLRGMAGGGGKLAGRE